MLNSNQESRAKDVPSLIPLAVPANVSVVDAAIELFALLFPLQNAQSQETLMEHLIKSATHKGGRITPIRKAACRLNSLVAIIGALKYISAKKGQLSSAKVSVFMRDLVQESTSSADPTIRSASCEIIGRVARICDNPGFINPMIQGFVDQVVNNRDPDVRAGCCLALGSIYNFVGGMAAGSHLRACVGIFHSLASDPHPHVHTWALHSLWLTIESAGLMYGPFVNSTLSLIAKLYISDSHEVATVAANGPGGDSNIEVYPVFGRILHALVGVIGPELQDSPKLRDICFNLFEQFKNDSNPFVVVEAIRCIQNFIIFTPKHVDIPTLIPFLQKQLLFDSKSQISVLRTAAVTCLYQLTQRDPASVLDAVVDNCLEEQLFALLDLEVDPSVRDEIKDILRALLRHVARTRPSRWIDLCKSILSKSNVNDPPKVSSLVKEVVRDDGEDGENQESVEPAKSVQNAQNTSKLTVSLIPRWRTQVFALTCLELVVDVVLAKQEREDVYLDSARLKQKQLIAEDKIADFLVFRLADLIRLAFNSSTGTVSFLKLSGLKFLRKILDVSDILIRIFRKSLILNSKAIVCWSSMKHKSFPPWLLGLK